MKTKEEIISNIEKSEIAKGIKSNKYYDVDSFIYDAERYINAVRERRMICIIDSVSSSGMSSVLRFLAPEKYTDCNTYSYLNYIYFFRALGFEESKNRNGFTVSGGGIGIVFWTNYTIIGRLKRIGFLEKEEADTLAQMTPPAL